MQVTQNVPKVKVWEALTDLSSCNKCNLTSFQDTTQLQTWSWHWKKCVIVLNQPWITTVCKQYQNDYVFSRSCLNFFCFSFKENYDGTEKSLYFSSTTNCSEHSILLKAMDYHRAVLTQTSTSLTTNNLLCLNDTTQWR